MAGRWGVLRGGQRVCGRFSLQLLHPPLELRPEEQQLLQALVHWHLQQQPSSRVRIRRLRSDRPPSAALGAPYLRSHARVPAGVVAAPQLEASGRYHRVQDVVLVVHVKGVGEVFGLAARRAPRSCHKPLPDHTPTHKTTEPSSKSPACLCTPAAAPPGASPPMIHALLLFWLDGRTRRNNLPLRIASGTESRVRRENKTSRNLPCK